MRILAGQTFKTQTLAKNWIKSQLQRIGYCDSITNQSDKELLFEIIKGHPDPEKIEGVIDFKIEPENKSYALFIVKKNSIEGISWVCCATGRGKTNNELLGMAMRYAIEHQINDYRKANHRCILCDNTERLEVDHIVMFKDLVKDFNKNREIPTKFKYDNNRTTFEDMKYCNEWIEYHKTHATLRMLCYECHKIHTKSQKKIFLV